MVPACAQGPLAHILGVGLGRLPGRRHISWGDLNWLYPAPPLSSILLAGRSYKTSLIVTNLNGEGASLVWV